MEVVVVVVVLDASDVGNLGSYQANIPAMFILTSYGRPLGLRELSQTRSSIAWLRVRVSLASSATHGHPSVGTVAYKIRPKFSFPRHWCQQTDGDGDFFPARDLQRRSGFLVCNRAPWALRIWVECVSISALL